MKASRIKISNILGIQELDVELGKITKISGPNGSGKTSLLTALRAVLKGGNQAEILRHGTEKGEIVLVLDDGVQIVKTIEDGETTTKLIHPEHGKISKPMQYIEKLADALSVNPIEFLECKASDRAEYLILAMPIAFNLEEIKNVLGALYLAPDIFNGIRMSDHALKAIDKIYDAMFTRRQDINRTLKEKNATIDQLSISVQNFTPAENLKKEISEMEGRVIILDRQSAEKLGELYKKGSDQVDEINDAKAKAMAVVDADYKAKYEELLSWYNKNKDMVHEKFSNERKHQAEEYDRDLKAITDAIQPQIDEGRTGVGILRQRLEESIKHQNTADVVSKMSTEAGKLKENSDGYTQTLNRLEQYKIGLLKDLPIAGIEIKGGKVYRNGIDYDSLNTAQQIEIAVDLAKLRAKELGLICLDGAECLDSERFNALEQAIAKTDLQIVVTRVSDEEFKVETK